MTDRKDNVVHFPKGIMRKRPTPTIEEEMAVRNLFRQTADDQPRPVAIVYKALAFMLGENSLPPDLRLDSKTYRDDNVILLCSFTSHPGAIATTLLITRALAGATADWDTKPLMVMEEAFHQMSPALSMYQVFSLKPSRSLLGALLAYGARLVAIENVNQGKEFIFEVQCREGVGRIIATIRFPYD